MEIIVDSNNTIPMYKQIVLQVKQLIANNQFQPGYKMPSVRALAAKLKINPATVDRAYQQLASVGILLTGRRKGTIVTGEKGRTPDLPVSQSRLYELVNVMISDSLIKLHFSFCHDFPGISINHLSGIIFEKNVGEL